MAVRVAAIVALLFGMAQALLGQTIGARIVDPEAFDTSPTTLQHEAFIQTLRYWSLLQWKRFFSGQRKSRTETYERLLSSLLLFDRAGQFLAAKDSPFTLIRGFEGLGAGLTGDDGLFDDMVTPADTMGAAGRKHYVQWVNHALAVFTKDGQLVLGPIGGSRLWAHFGGRCETDDDGDPIVLYDQRADRWVLSQFAYDLERKEYYECIAISLTDDPTGRYYRYAFRFGDWNDYPKFGVWSNAYFATYNMLVGNDPENVKPSGSEICAYDRDNMLAGKWAPAQCMSVDRQNLQPVSLDGTQLPQESAGLFLAPGEDQNHLTLWQLDVKWVDPAATVLSAPLDIDVAAFTPPCAGLRAACVPQPVPGNQTPLNALGKRLMYRASYRRLGSEESLYATHAVSLIASGGGDVTAFRWYEIRDFRRGAAKVYQQSTFEPDHTARWVAAMASDKNGNIAFGFNRSSSTIFPSIALTGRVASDTLSTLRKDVTVQPGSGTQAITSWGDYSSMTVDPADDCTFWFTAQYLTLPQNNRWHTYIVKARFPDCK